MKAAIMHGFNRELTIEEIDLGGPRAGEVLVNLKASGVQGNVARSVLVME